MRSAQEKGEGKAAQVATQRAHLLARFRSARWATGADVDPGSVAPSIRRLGCRPCVCACVRSAELEPRPLRGYNCRLARFSRKNTEKESICHARLTSGQLVAVGGTLSVSGVPLSHRAQDVARSMLSREFSRRTSKPSLVYPALTTVSWPPVWLTVGQKLEMEIWGPVFVYGSVCESWCDRIVPKASLDWTNPYGILASQSTRSF